MFRSLISKVRGESPRQAIADTARRPRRMAPRVEGLEHRELLSGFNTSPSTGPHGGQRVNPYVYSPNG